MSNSPAGAWHTDPAGRHQLRWWDGARWTDQVADNGVVGVEALPPPGVRGEAAAAAGGTDPGPVGMAPVDTSVALLERTNLLYRSGGGAAFPPAWWQVTDEQRRPVAKVWRRNRANTLCDLNGGAIIGTDAGRSSLGASTGGHNRIQGVKVLDAAGSVLSAVGYVAVGHSLKLHCGVGNQKKVLSVVIDRSMLGVVKSVALLDRSKQHVGTITPLEREGNPLKYVTLWLQLERPPGLPEPLRSLVMAAPLLVSSYEYFVNV